MHVRAGKADLDHSHHCEITTVLTAARVSRHASLYDGKSLVIGLVIISVLTSWVKEDAINL